MHTSHLGVKKDAYFLDGCAIIWVVAWPGVSNAVIQDYLNAFRAHARRYQEMCSSYLIVTSTATPRKSHDWHETRGDQSLQNKAYVKTPGCKAPFSVTSITSSPT